MEYKYERELEDIHQFLSVSLLQRSAMVFLIVCY